MSTTINFYEGSYCFNSIATDLNVTNDFICFKLVKQYEHRPTKESLWAIVYQDSKEVSRFELKYGCTFNQIK